MQNVSYALERIKVLFEAVHIHSFINSSEWYPQNIAKIVLHILVS